MAAFRNKNFTLHGQLPLEAFLQSSSLLQQMFLELKYAWILTYIPGTSASCRWIFKRNFCNILNFFRFISFNGVREATTFVRVGPCTALAFHLNRIGFRLKGLFYNLWIDGIKFERFFCLFFVSGIIYPFFCYA